jgi:hypothetical protein
VVGLPLHGSAAMLTLAALAQLSSEPPCWHRCQRCTLLVCRQYAANALELPALAQKYPDVLAHRHPRAARRRRWPCVLPGSSSPPRLVAQQARLDAHWAFKSFFMRIVPQADFSVSEAISVNDRLGGVVRRRRAKC